MSVSASWRAVLPSRGWLISRERRSVRIYVVLVDVVAVVWSLGAVLELNSPARMWGVFALLCVLAVAFEESARHTGRLQFRMSGDLKRDMTSVWSVTAAVALSAGLAVLLHVVVLGYLWFRQQRPAGEILYRKFCSSCAAVLGCLTAGRIMHLAQSSWFPGAPATLVGTFSVLIVIVVHTCVDRAIITGAMLSLGLRGEALIGTLEDHYLELATLCLGGLLALAAVYQPWLCILVFPPMIVLQRGAFVTDMDTAATTDPKTGLLNAIAWDQVAKRELARSRRDHEPVGVLIVDIDRFKLVNDRYGHLVGDDVLREIGRCLGEAVREYDTVGRFGGEEFVAVLPAADDTAALIVAERLRSHVNRLRVSDIVDAVPAPGPGEPEDRLAVSVGVATAPTDGIELADVLHAADSALYRAKAAGRNRVALAGRSGGAAQDVSAA